MEREMNAAVEETEKNAVGRKKKEQTKNSSRTQAAMYDGRSDEWQ